MNTPGDYRVVFEFERRLVQLQTPFSEQWTFEQLANGFWIDEEPKLVRESQGKYWIPPSRLVRIEIVK